MSEPIGSVNDTVKTGSKEIVGREHNLNVRFAIDKSDPSGSA